MSFNDLIDDTVKRALNFTNGGSGGISYIYGGSNISVLNPSGATPTISVIDPLVNNEVDTNILTATTSIQSNLIENLTNDELIIKQNNVSSIKLNTDGNGTILLTANPTTDNNYIAINGDGSISMNTSDTKNVNINTDYDGGITVLPTNGFIINNTRDRLTCYLYIDNDGNLHAVVNDTTDYQLTPPSGIATNIVNNSTGSYREYILQTSNTRTESDGIALVNLCSSQTQNDYQGTSEVLTIIQQSANIASSIPPSLIFSFKNQDSLYLPITFKTNTDGTSGLVLDNDTNNCILYPDIYGNLHAIVSNDGTPIDYLLTGLPIVNTLTYNGATATPPTIISMTNTTDGSFIPYLNVLQASLQSETNNSIFQIAYNGSTTSGAGSCDVYLTNQNVTTGVYNRIWVIAPDATDGGFVIANPANSTTCILYADDIGNLHGVVGSGSIDCLLTGMNPFSINGSLFPSVFNQSDCPVSMGFITATPPQNIYVRNNVIVNISINGTVEPTIQPSPIAGGIAPDMITLGFNVIFQYAHRPSTNITLTTTPQLYCSTIFGDPYPISCSFTEVINTGYPSGAGYCAGIFLEAIFVNGYYYGNDYGFNFNNVNITITPQNV